MVEDERPLEVTSALRLKHSSAIEYTQSTNVTLVSRPLSDMGDTDSVEDIKVPIHVEICVKPTSTAAPEEIKQAVEQYLSTKSLWYREGSIPLPDREETDSYLNAHVSSLILTDIEQHQGTAGVPVASMLLFWKGQLTLVVYQLNEQEVADDDEGEDSVASYR